MKQAFLIRNDVRSDCIRGLLVADGELFHTLERPWLENRPNKSCICPAQYRTEYLERSASGKYRNIFCLLKVPGRTGILIHNGNVPAHTKGCILIGKRRGFLAGQPAVLNSRTALGEFVDLMDRSPFEITIIGGQTC